MPLCALTLFGLITPLMMPCPDAPRPRLGLMKKVFLTSIAALLLATGTAHAQVKKASPEQVTKWPSPNFEADCRRDRIIVHVDEKAKGDWPAGFELPGVQVVPPRDGERRFVIINDVDKAARTRLEKMLRDWRKCDAYYQCLADRDAGKVKHCYANDKRWRDIYSGEL